MNEAELVQNPEEEYPEFHSEEKVMEHIHNSEEDYIA